MCFLCLTDRSRLTWRTPPSTTSSARSSSRSSGTWGNLARRCWACPARASPLTTGACRQGRATAPPTALWPYCPWTLTARKRQDHADRRARPFYDTFDLTCISACRWMMSLMTSSAWSPVTVMTCSAWWIQDFRWRTRYAVLTGRRRSFWGSYFPSPHPGDILRTSTWTHWSRELLSNCCAYLFTRFNGPKSVYKSAPDASRSPFKLISWTCTETRECPSRVCPSATPAPPTCPTSKGNTPVSGATFHSSSLSSSSSGRYSPGLCAPQNVAPYSVSSSCPPVLTAPSLHLCPLCTFWLL